MKKYIIILSIVFFVSTIYSAELGFIVGTVNNNTGLNIGFSAGMGMLLPLLKVEYELTKNPDIGNKTITTGIKLKPKLGNFSPYALIGIGTDFEKFSLEFSSYSTFTLYAGGLYIYFSKLFSIRFDFRFMNYKTFNKTRLSGGIFLNF